MSEPRQLLLASASPRRQELLARIGVAFRVVCHDVDETPLADESARDFACRMAREKAESALRLHTADEDDLVLGSDTVVTCDGLIMGKPSGREQAVEMLRRLSGREHQVLSAVTVGNRGGLATRISSSQVRFRKLQEAEILAYWETGEPRGKAGAYAIQGLGAVFIESLHGSYSGVMGLPLFETAGLLRQYGYPVWLVGTPPGVNPR